MVRPGFKQSEAGEIPSDWHVRELRDIAIANWGNTSITKASYREAGYRAYSASGPDGFVSWFEQDSPAVVLSAIGAQCGRTWLAGDKWTPIKNTIWFRANGDDSDTAYLYRITGTPDFWPRRGQAQPFIALGDVRAARIPVPPTKAEQTAIAEALSDVDSLIEALERLLDKKRHVLQGAKQELLAGKRRLPGFSGSWEIRRLGDLFAFNGGFTASRDQLSQDGFCYLHYGDIHKSSKSLIDVQTEYQLIPKLKVSLKRVPIGSLLEDGDVVFVDASEDDEGTSKHVVVLNKDKVPFISGLHTIVAKSKTGELDRNYRRYCFQTAAIRQQFLFYAVGTKVSGISKSNIARLTLPVPPLSEQIAIAAILSDMDAELAALDAKLGKTRLLKQGMMQELLTGRTRLV
jgi:type I restriction enzyme S subunit